MRKKKYAITSFEEQCMQKYAFKYILKNVWKKPRRPSINYVRYSFKKKKKKKQMFCWTIYAIICSKICAPHYVDISK